MGVGYRRTNGSNESIAGGRMKGSRTETLVNLQTTSCRRKSRPRGLRPSSRATTAPRSLRGDRRPLSGRLAFRNTAPDPARTAGEALRDRGLARRDASFVPSRCPLPPRHLHPSATAPTSPRALSSPLYPIAFPFPQPVPPRGTPAVRHGISLRSLKNHCRVLRRPRPTDKFPREPCLLVVAGPNHRYPLSRCRRRARLVDSAGFDPTPHSLDRQDARRRYGFRSASSPPSSPTPALRDAPAKRTIAFALA